MIIGFWVWFSLTLLLLFIPLYLLKKGKPMTHRDLLFFLLGLWMMGGSNLIITLSKWLAVHL